MSGVALIVTFPRPGVGRCPGVHLSSPQSLLLSLVSPESPYVNRHAM